MARWVAACALIVCSTLQASGQTFTLPWWHPTLENIAKNKLVAPGHHSSVDGALAAVLSAHSASNHTAFDGPTGLLRVPRDYPANHPNLDALFPLGDQPAGLRVSISDYHPNISSSWAAGTVYPGHVAVYSHLQSYLPSTHVDVDIFLRNPSVFTQPWFHPPFDMMVTRRPASTFTVEVMFHPDPDVEYVAGRAIRPSHPLVAAMLSSEIPPNHTDVDTLLRDPASHPLPSWHPRLEAMLRRSASAKATLPEVMVALDHPDADAEYRAGNPISLTHPSVQELMKGHLPPDHPDCDTLLRDPAAHPLPAWHPRLNDMMAHRSLWSPGLIFSMLCFATLLLAIMIRAGAKCSSKVYKRLHRADLNRNEVVHRVPVQIKKRSARSYEDGGESAASSPEFDDTEVKPALPMRNIELNKMNQLHKGHRPHDREMYEFEAVRRRRQRNSAIEVSNSQVHTLWVRITESRIPGTNWPTGSVLFYLLYISLNVLALLVAKTYACDRGLGSLAAANTMMLVVPATRNNIMTWFLAIPFDHILKHHRFLGRITVFISFVHGALYFERFLEHSTQRAYWTGMGALCCGLGIAFTTTDFFRRKLFNVFFWTHYLFLGFFVLVILHVRQARPFVYTAIAIYALDKVLRFVFTQVPTRTTEICTLDDRTARVVFPKNSLNKLMGRHRVGQFLFVNFPELSLTEWHPFSVASSPHDDSVELAIRALGDHTRKIHTLAKTCAAEGRQTRVRTDGPYGCIDVDYRRYSVLMLVGGGIGITAIMSIINDIYGPKRSNAPHCIKWVYLVWVMPHAQESIIFQDAIDRCKRAAAADKSLPGLTVHVHCTRDVPESAVGEIIRGRPDFPGIMDAAAKRLPGWPTMVYACGPGKMVNELWDESNCRNTRDQRVDFHHGVIFEF